jgi:hypothetical protein
MPGKRVTYDDNDYEDAPPFDSFQGEDESEYDDYDSCPPPPPKKKAKKMVPRPRAQLSEYEGGDDYDYAEQQQFRAAPRSRKPAPAKRKAGAYRQDPAVAERVKKMRAGLARSKAEAQARGMTLSELKQWKKERGHFGLTR